MATACLTDSLQAAQGVEKPLVPALNPGLWVGNFTALQAAYCKPRRSGRLQGLRDPSCGQGVPSLSRNPKERLTAGLSAALLHQGDFLALLNVAENKNRVWNSFISVQISKDLGLNPRSTTSCVTGTT